MGEPGVITYYLLLITYYLLLITYYSLLNKNTLVFSITRAFEFEFNQIFRQL